MQLWWEQEGVFTGSRCANLQAMASLLHNFCSKQGFPYVEVSAPFCCKVYVSFVVTDEVKPNVCLSLGWSKKLTKRCCEEPIWQVGSAVSTGLVSCFAGPWSVHAPSSASTANSGSERAGRDASRAAAGSTARTATHAGPATARSFGQQDRSLPRSVAGTGSHGVNLLS